MGELGTPHCPQFFFAPPISSSSGLPARRRRYPPLSIAAPHIWIYASVTIKRQSQRRCSSSISPPFGSAGSTSDIVAVKKRFDYGVAQLHAWMTGSSLGQEDSGMEEEPIYHERQRLQFCLLHALNNLMQEKKSFRRDELDAIAEKLVSVEPLSAQWTPLSLIFKPHHNAFTGNYDVNVLLAALESRKKKVVWHDRRNEASSINLAEESLMGIMLNIPVRRFGGLWNGRHWVSLRRINGIWYNLDSDLSAPMPFEDQEELILFLNNVINQGGEILSILHENL